jgi:hypothetical protein
MFVVEFSRHITLMFSHKKRQSFTHPHGCLIPPCCACRACHATAARRGCCARRPGQLPALPAAGPSQQTRRWVWGARRLVGCVLCVVDLCGRLCGLALLLPPCDAWPPQRLSLPAASCNGALHLPPGLYIIAIGTA